MSKALEVIDLCKTYYSSSKKKLDKKALSNLNLIVEQGDIFGLLGPNGAGKSTLINILAGTVVKSSGTVNIMNINIDENQKFAKTKIGVVPQEISLDTFFPISEALEFYAGYYGIRQKDRKTNEIIDALGLTDQAHLKSRDLSGGMKRRFLVAKAMVHSPDVLILDEPTAGVDIELRDKLWDYVKQLNRNGTTIILTTHYLAEAEKLCNKIAFINGGKIVKSDTKKNLLSSLSNKELNITLSQKISEIPENLKKYNIELPSYSELKIKYNKHKLPLEQILKDLVEAEFEMVDIKVNEGNLEDIFRTLYKKV